MATADFCKGCPVGGHFNAGDQTCSVVDPTDELPLACVGAWVAEKHLRLEKYITISGPTRRKYGRGGTTYIDLFCGPGRARIRGTTKIVDGSALVAAKTSTDVGAPFTDLFIGDTNQSFVDFTRARLAGTRINVGSCTGPAEATSQWVASTAPKLALHFAFLDPYDLKTLPFVVIQRLAAFKRMDILIHVSAQDLQRNLDRYLLSAKSPLDVFAPGWRSKVKNTANKREARRQVFEHWLSLIRELDMQPAQGVEDVTGSRSQHLYWLVFVARHELAIKFWEEIRAVTKQKALDL